MRGTLIISLDFELFWGVRDVKTIEGYGANLRGVRQAIPAMLALFEQYGVHATWATVGLVFFDSRVDLLAHLPSVTPAYANPTLSPYPELSSLGEDEDADPCHFGRRLIKLISAVPGQEIGSHTFSHYYTLERGQTVETFRHDLLAAVQTGRSLGLELRSLVFPRNQYNPSYLGVCRDLGFTSYRGNEDSWIYQHQTREPLVRRGARLLDAYVNLSGHHTFRFEDVARSGVPYNLPSSRFLRPWSAMLRVGEEPRLRRIERAMTWAAHQGEAFHLWWHPHNFGLNLARNIANLARLLDHFSSLRSGYGMESCSMGEVATRLTKESARPDHAGIA